MESAKKSQESRMAAGDSSSINAFAQSVEGLSIDPHKVNPAGGTLSYAAVAGSKNADESTADGLRKSNLSAEAAEFVPRWLTGEEKRGNASGPDFGKLDPAAAADFRSFAERMVKSPNQADDVLPLLLDRLREENSVEIREDVLNGLCGIIIEKAVTDYSARHAMGRMINVLLQSFDSPKNGSMGAEFWSALNARFTREHEKSAETLGKNPARYKTFAFFLAEVLGTSSRMFGHQKANELSDLLLEVLEDFFRTEDGEQWKIAGQVLKQVGGYLEDNFAGRKDLTSVSDMDRFMNGVDNRGHSGREDIPFYIRSMLINIMELRAYNWGRSTTPSGSHSVPVHAPANSYHEAPYVANNVVCHDGSGMALNSEERQFLESEGCFDECNEEGDNGMDEEMEKDYELFLQMNSNGQ